ncbi:uncharacterized protein LOC135208077 [Macrobrachium nipponense]|uniref:uncharacterized protein LOC135208077 n=1 Tax=Macrobrachium nipponense TaxID=159736 RepID=UPI0030C8B269
MKECQGKLDGILSDSSKFEHLTRNLTEDIKRDANWVFSTINAATNTVHLPPILADFSLGYLYGNVKTHKEGNPLHQIISQIPAPTYALAKHLNQIPSRYSLSTLLGFLKEICNSTCTGIMVSLDVESTFTNMPVDETIDIILNCIYLLPSTAPLNIPEASLHTLMDICTKEPPSTPIKDRCSVRRDGFALGSPLGVLFANFYMGMVEERDLLRASAG